MKAQKVINAIRVKPGKKIRLKDYDPAWLGEGELRELSKKELKEKAQAFLSNNLEELSQAQELLYANDTHSVLLIIQGMDAAGKDGTIKHVMSGVNPQGCQAFCFKKPSDEELDHNFLWRYMKSLPERGRICIFNRSHYEDVLVVKVHPEILAGQKLPDFKNNKEFWNGRYEDINNFEQHLARNGTVILKFFMNVSKGEQKNRFLERLENPEKHWKFSPADLAERKFWKEYQQAFEDCINATSTDWAPWYIIPADNKWVARCLVAFLLTQAIKNLNLKMPEITPAKMELIEKARKELAAEK